MDVFLIRHTTPNVPEGICYGQSDVELAPSFAEESEAVRSKLGNIEEMTFYSSPLRRCLRLAQRLAKTPPILDDRLMEMDFGRWEMTRWDELDRTETEYWMADFVNRRPPEGETYAELYRRSIDFLNDVSGRKESPIAAITHGGVIRSIIVHVLGMKLEDFWRIRIDYGGVTKVEINGHQLRIGFINR